MTLSATGAGARRRCNWDRARTGIVCRTARGREKAADRHGQKTRGDKDRQMPFHDNAFPVSDELVQSKAYYHPKIMSAKSPN